MTVSKTSELWEILVPCVMQPVSAKGVVNWALNPRPIRMRHHYEWDRFVRRLTGGLTVLRTGKGTWISPEGELFEERMIPVRIMCDEPTINKIARFSLRHYRQKAIMFFRISERCTILEA